MRRVPTVPSREATRSTARPRIQELESYDEIGGPRRSLGVKVRRLPQYCMRAPRDTVRHLPTNWLKTPDIVARATHPC